MPFQPGQQKPPGSGRKKGQSNSKKLPKVAEYFATNDINPVRELMELLPSLMPGQQMAVWLELLKYCQPTFRPIESLPEPDESEMDVSSLSEDELIAVAQGGASG
jgi:hypothetical protein